MPSRAVARGGWSVCRLAGSRCGLAWLLTRCAGAVEFGGVEFAVVLLQWPQCGQPLRCAVALMRVYGSCASRLAGGDAVAVFAVHGPWPSVRMGRCMCVCKCEHAAHVMWIVDAVAGGACFLLSLAAGTCIVVLRCTCNAMGGRVRVTPRLAWPYLDSFSDLGSVVGTR